MSDGLNKQAIDVVVRSWTCAMREASDKQAINAVVRTWSCASCGKPLNLEFAPRVMRIAYNDGLYYVNRFCNECHKHTNLSDDQIRCMPKEIMVHE
jgi:C4-type Zn-finger protein